MKMLCRTTGQFMLFNSRLGVEIDPGGIGLTTSGAWSDMQINQGQLQILSSGLSDEVMDDEVQDVFNQFEHDIEATVEYFEMSYPWDGEYPERVQTKEELDSVVKQIQRSRAEAEKEVAEKAEKYAADREAAEKEAAEREAAAVEKAAEEAPTGT